jgi:NTP pyrophosphatase (non-canonical NTP hydrolase)
MMVLTLNEYQQQTLQTAVYPGRGTMQGIVYTALKLNGEAGEVAEHIGKALRDDGGIITPERRTLLKKELGDVLWYISSLADELGFGLGAIAVHNLEKLADRKTRGVLGGSGDNR